MSSDDVNSVGRRFEEEVKRLGGPVHVAALVDRSRNTIYNWCRSADMTARDLVLLAEHGMDTMYVLTGRRNVMSQQAEALGIAERSIDRITGFLESGDASRIRVVVAGREYFVNPDDYRWIPLLDVKVAGGVGSAVLGENVIAFNAYRKAWLAEQGLLEAVLSEVTITGRSMEPVLPEGKTVLVNHSLLDPQGGSIFVVRQDGDLIAKYLQKLPGGRLQVSSENTQAFETYEVTEEDIETGRFAIIGCVVPR